MGKKDKNSTAKTGLTLLIGALISLTVCILLLLFFSVGILQEWFELSHGRQLALIACAISGFVGAMYAVRKIKRSALPVGLGTGALFGLLLLIPSSVCIGEAQFGGPFLSALFLCLCAGGLAGFTGRKRKKRRLT